MLNNVLIIGAGLIGGSMAKSLREKGVSVSVVDSCSETRLLLEQDGFIVYEHVSLVEDYYDWCVIATPMNCFSSVFSECEKKASLFRVVSDVMSVKGLVSDCVTDSLLEDKYVSLHPMAGREVSGYSYSCSSLLKNKKWIVCTDIGNPLVMSENTSFLDCWNDTFEPRVSFLSTSKHDEVTAMVSHVMNLISSSVLLMMSDYENKEVASRLVAGSFNDVTRVGKQENNLIEEMIMFNSRSIIDVYNVFHRVSNELLDSGNNEVLREELRNKKREVVRFLNNNTEDDFVSVSLLSLSDCEQLSLQGMIGEYQGENIFRFS